jgi:hypothetical protein
MDAQPDLETFSPIVDEFLAALGQDVGMACAILNNAKAIERKRAAWAERKNDPEFMAQHRMGRPSAEPKPPEAPGRTKPQPSTKPKARGEQSPHQLSAEVKIQRVTDAYALAAGGMTAKEIGLKLGHSPVTIHCWLKGQNLGAASTVDRSALNR